MVNRETVEISESSMLLVDDFRLSYMCNLSAIYAVRIPKGNITRFFGRWYYNVSSTVSTNECHVALVCLNKYSSCWVGCEKYHDDAGHC